MSGEPVRLVDLYPDDLSAAGCSGAQRGRRCHSWNRRTPALKADTSCSRTCHEHTGRWAGGALRGPIIFLPSLLLESAGRAWLRRTVLRHEVSRTDDVTVLIGARNRANYRLENALRSIRSQTYPADLVRIVVVDYGSEPVGASRTASMCARHDAEYLRVDGVEVWSRSRCLNIGIRHANTKFLLVSDVDIVFPPRLSVPLCRGAHGVADLDGWLDDARPSAVVCVHSRTERAHWKRVAVRLMEAVVSTAPRPRIPPQHLRHVYGALPSRPGLRRVLRGMGQ